jgi:hypothetical protein
MTLLETITHPYRLYSLLCQAARLYFDSGVSSRAAMPSMMHGPNDGWAQFDFAQSGWEAGSAGTDTLTADGFQMYGLYDWCHDSQQLMELMSEEMMF